MKNHVMYSQKIKHYNKIFKSTVEKYRSSVDFFINVCLEKWDMISEISGSKAKQRFVETITVRTGDNPVPEYDFSFFIPPHKV